MKKKCNKKIRMIAAMIALAMIVQVFSPVLTAKAADDPCVDNFTGVYEPKNKSQTNWLYIQNFPKNARVKNLKSSNTKVLKASWNKKDPEFIVLKFKKTGKATVSFDVVYGNRTKSLKSKVTVNKYQRPCSSYKIGKKNYASKLKGTSYYMAPYKGNQKYKISIKPAKGWKLQEINYSNNKMNKNKKIKNNTTIKCSGKKNSYTWIEAWFENKKTGQIQLVYMTLYRK